MEAFVRRFDWSAHRLMPIHSEGQALVRDFARSGTDVARLYAQSGPRNLHVMSLVRLIGFTTLACGCVVGKYREVATSREVAYVEEKGRACGAHGHRRNHTIAVVDTSSARSHVTSKAS
jgi:hypothetical protein